MKQGVFQHGEIRDAPGTGTDMNKMIGPALDIVGKCIRPGEAGDHQLHAAHRAFDQHGREKRRELRLTRNVPLLLDGDGKIFLVRR